MATRAALLLTVFIVTVSAQPRSNNPACYLCGSASTVVTNPDGIVIIPDEFDSPLPQAKCDTIAKAALGGLVSDKACAAAQNSVELQTVCGCQESETNKATAQPNLIPVALPTPPPTEEPTSATAQPTMTTVCYVCGSETAVLTKPETILPIPFELAPPFRQASCQTLAMAGLLGFIPLEACVAAHTFVQLQEFCGCQEPQETDVQLPNNMKPNEMPKPPRSHAICDICGGDDTEKDKKTRKRTPDIIVVDKPLQQTACSMLEIAGLSGYIPKKTCELAQSSIEVQDMCACLDRNSTPSSPPPTSLPSSFPTDVPSHSPSKDPTISPSGLPSAQPSKAADNILEDLTVSSPPKSSQFAEESSAHHCFGSTVWFVFGTLILALSISYIA